MRTFCNKTIASIALALLGTGMAWAQTPVALYTCDESSGATLANTGSLGTSKNATASGTYSRSTGVVGANALTLSGTGCATISGAVVNTASSYTAAAWVKLTSLTAYGGILSCDGANVSGFYLEYSSDAQRFAFTTFESDSTSAATHAAVGTAAPATGTWYHIAGVYNSSAKTLALYVNGVLQQSVSCPTIWQCTGNTLIGRTKWGGNALSYLQGSVDDVRLYTSALTAAQITTLYNMASCPPTAITPYIQVNGGSWTQTSTATVSSGATVKFGPQPVSGGSWSWTGPNGYTATTREITVTPTATSTYVATYTNTCGAKSTQSFVVTVSGTTTYTLTISAGTGGTTSPSPGTYTYNSGTVVSVTATANSGYTFSGWSGAATGTANPVSITMNGNKTLTASFTANGGGSYYTWPAYSPTIAYDYVNEYGTINPPTTVLNDCSGVAGTYANGWWCFRYGNNKNSLVTSAAWTPMIARYNTDFSYISDTMRWPRDLRARSGYYSAVYLYGSGLCTDSAPNTDTGGWQSAISYNNVNYPMVLASYYPVYCFDPACTYSDKTSQQGAMIHEGIHCILASMPGCFNACWFNEGGNTWLQGTMTAQRSGSYASMGWLSAGMAIAPFMPIECYSGWLQDNSFGGPCAEGVNMTDSSGNQVCTWRKLLGGTQYGECFPHGMEVILGFKSIAWTWRYCSASGRVLQDIAQVSGGLGDAQTRRLIQEFRARQAMCDFGNWSAAYKQLLLDNWNVAIGPEWSPYWINCPTWNSTCYALTTQNGSVLTPETRTLPGWSGANQIPLTVSGSTATVTFNPIGSNMSCQLVYRDTSGNIRYSTPVSSGTCSIPLSNVKNNIVIAVICNTDYIYYGESTRTAHYNYTLTLGSGVTGKADIYTQWFN